MNDPENEIPKQCPEQKHAIPEEVRKFRTSSGISRRGPEIDMQIPDRLELTCMFPDFVWNFQTRSGVSGLRLEFPDEVRKMS